MIRHLTTKLTAALWVVSLFVFSEFSASICQAKSDTLIVGAWQGTLEAGGTKLRVVLHVMKDDSGHLSATLDSPDQGAYGISFSLGER